MSLGNLPDNKLLSLALHGYNAYQPECGIFCGGYPGLLYPNPTTLSLPGFDPYQYTNPIMTEYSPDTQYTGLGLGNPGIDYKNPGHILGLLDTFARMSYGLGIILATHTGDNGGGGISPLVNINIPMIGVSENSTLGIENLYPSISEIPCDWLASFTILEDGTVTPDPRDFVSFSTGTGHIPSLSVLNAEILANLFYDKTVLSYYGMPQYLRSIIESLSSAIGSTTTKSELNFTLDSPHIFNNYSHQSNLFPEIDDLIYHELIQDGWAVHQCHTFSPLQSLKVMTDYDNYHDGANDMNEYRSLTELNSVINLVPLQTIGATYWLDDHSYREVVLPGGGVIYEVDEWTQRAFVVASYIISDLLLNISNVPAEMESTTVVINGTVTVKSIITDPTAYHWTLTQRMFAWPPPGPIVTTTFGNAQRYKKSANIAMSMTNLFTWDRSWLGGGSVTDDYAHEDQKAEVTYDGGNSNIGFVLLDQSDLVVPFSKTFTLAPGCNSIRMRIFGQNMHSIDQNGDHMVPPSRWIDPALPNPGVHSCGYIYDPDVVPDNIEKSNIQISFTVTGSKISPIPFAVSL